MKFTTSCIVTALLCAPAIVNAAPTGSGPTIKNAGQIKSGNAFQIGKDNSNVDVNALNAVVGPSHGGASNAGQINSGNAIQKGKGNSNLDINAGNFVGPSHGGSSNAGQIDSGNAVQVGKDNSNTNINAGNTVLRRAGLLFGRL